MSFKSYKINTYSIDFKKGGGILPAIVQDEKTLEVLMLGYMSEESLALSLSTNKVTFFSRSKNRLWQKGETSGNFLWIKQVLLDCDGDTFLFIVQPNGSTCHLGNHSCFAKNIQSNEKKLGFFSELEQVIEDKIYGKNNSKSYTNNLYQSGIKRIAQKVGEEGVELALASVCGNTNEIIREAADLFFHIIVLLKSKHISLNDIENELKNRREESLS